MMACSAENARLAKLTTCSEIQFAMSVIHRQFLKDGQTYFIGAFAFEDPDDKSQRNWDDQTLIDS